MDDGGKPPHPIPAKLRPHGQRAPARHGPPGQPRQRRRRPRGAPRPRMERRGAGMREGAIGLVWTGAGWHAMTAGEAEAAFGERPGWLELDNVVASEQLAFLLIAPCAGVRDDGKDAQEAVTP